MEKYILTFITLLITSYEFNTKNLSDGAYITIITLDNNNSLNKKIIIQNN